MAEEARTKYKITSIQSRKMYEILRLRATDPANPEEYKAYRLDVKKRLNRAFQKEKKAMARQRERLTEEVFVHCCVTQNVFVVKYEAIQYVILSIPGTKSTGCYQDPRATARISR